MINGSFAENDVQLKTSYASSPPFSELAFSEFAKETYHFKERTNRSHSISQNATRHTSANTCSRIQGGEDAEDALSRRSLSAKEPLIVGLFCGISSLNMRHPMRLRHPVLHTFLYIYKYIYIHMESTELF